MHATGRQADSIGMQGTGRPWPPREKSRTLVVHLHGEDLDHARVCQDVGE